MSSQSALGRRTSDEKKHSRRQYRTPPIVEATCEFRFAPGDAWNQTVGWAFYERVKSRYSGHPRDQRILQFADLQGGLGSPQQRAIEINQVQIPSKTDQQLVTVAPNMVSIHVKKPYPGWEDFREQIEYVLSAYVDVAKPKGIRRIGIRYINQISTLGITDPHELFVECPSGSICSDAELRQFVHRNEYIFEDEPIKGAVVFAFGVYADDPSAFLLDVDVSQEWQPESLPFRSAMKRVDELRTREREMFEACITDKARQVFDA